MNQSNMNGHRYKIPGAKRLMLEAMELKDKTEDYWAQPIDDNLFEWHFTLRGPPDTAFEGGIYHGRISFPTDYPMKPPYFIMLTPNGRFVTNRKICLSISGHHPETWQPSWSVRTALLAIIGFMPSNGEGAIGSLNLSDEERRMLARRSRSWRCDKCGPIKALLKWPNTTAQATSASSETSPVAPSDESHEQHDHSNENNLIEQKSQPNNSCNDSPIDRSVDNEVTPQGTRQTEQIEQQQWQQNSSSLSSGLSSRTDDAQDALQNIKLSDEFRAKIEERPNRKKSNGEMVRHSANRLIRISANVRGRAIKRKVMKSKSTRDKKSCRKDTLPPVDGSVSYMSDDDDDTIQHSSEQIRANQYQVQARHRSPFGESVFIYLIAAMLACLLLRRLYNSIVPL